ncbi:MAG: GNAT family N-acetyltransferase [Emergencia timonensis]|uniref:GNAT family N-acetyltransferase n=1 Tax=Emergencia timonensis TaxID=1776384 RepID=UPI0008318287|nr:GNAT family N-acetyltransferase [Emergencia timonensis]WNX90456.1 GNAT family N-acetyltransferase [Emergencia timonensis]
MILETKRLILRPWEECDAESLYKYAKDPNVGPIAGWPVHTSVDHSREIIKDVLSAENSFAVVLKEMQEAVGSISLMSSEHSNLDIGSDDVELGYWIGVPFWGQGLIPEAAEALIQYGFDRLGVRNIWCGYFEGNDKSKRVQEKCGFKFHHTEKDKPWPLMGDIRTEQITCLTRQQWRHVK